MTTKEATFTRKDVVRVGLVGGVAALLLCLVGMVPAFHARGLIAGALTMGQALLAVVFLVTGWTVAKKARGKSPAVAVASAILASALAAAMLVLLVLVGQRVDLRQVLVNASPDLFNILLFDRELGVGALYLLGAAAAGGVLGGAIELLPNRLSRAVGSALFWVVSVAVLQDTIRVALSTRPAALDLVRWAFAPTGQKGLSIYGAIALFVLIAAGSYFGSRQGASLQGRVRAWSPGRQRVLRVFLGVWAIAALLTLPNVLGPTLTDVTNYVGIFILMGLGLNIVVGFAGLLDLGYVAFFAIGAYVVGVLTTTGGELLTSFGWSFWLALPLAIGASVLAGFLLGVPVLHIRGDYLAIVTLGFGEIIRIMALSDFLKPYVGGSQGIVALDRGAIGSLVVFDRPQTLYYLILAAVLVGAFVAIRLKDSRLGRTWMAMREDEDVAEAMGINLVNTKLLAFATGAAFSGLAGAIFALRLASIYPSSFDLLKSILALSIIIVGGMGSIPGVIIGAIALVGLPELLREFDEFRLLVYGAALVAMMLLRPEGLWPEESRRRELHFEEGAPVAEAIAAKEAVVATD